MCLNKSLTNRWPFQGSVVCWRLLLFALENANGAPCSTFTERVYRQLQFAQKLQPTRARPQPRKRMFGASKSEPRPPSRRQCPVLCSRDVISTIYAAPPTLRQRLRHRVLQRPRTTATLARGDAETDASAPARSLLFRMVAEATKGKFQACSFPAEHARAVHCTHRSGQHVRARHFNSHIERSAKRTKVHTCRHQSEFLRETRIADVPRALWQQVNNRWTVLSRSWSN